MIMFPKSSCGIVIKSIKFNHHLIVGLFSTIKRRDKNSSVNISQLLDSNVISVDNNNNKQDTQGAVRNSKMLKSLKVKSKSVLDIRSQGSLDSTCEDLMDNMNEVDVVIVDVFVCC